MQHNKIHKIIKESISKVINEVSQETSNDLVPQDGIFRDSNLTHWKMLYNTLPNIRKYMDAVYQGKMDRKQKITKTDVDNLIKYINMTVNNILRI